MRSCCADAVPGVGASFLEEVNTAMFRPDWNRYGGAVGAAVLADYVDLRARPVSGRMTNSELLALVLALADSFGYNVPFVSNYPGALQGAADWGIGMLAAGIARRRLAPPPPPPVQTTAPFGAGVAGVVPAASSSAAAELPSGY
jgi:hypothetical protein